MSGGPAAAPGAGIRVLRVLGGLDTRGGGPTVSSVGSIVAQIRDGSAVTVAVPLEAADMSQGPLEELRAAGASIRPFARSRVARTAAKRLGFSPQLIGFLMLRTRRFDVVHAHGAWTASSIAALAAALIWRRPFLLTPHETFTQFDIDKVGWARSLAKRTLRRVYLRFSSAIIVSSELELLDSVPPRFRAKCVAIGHPVRHRDRTSPTEVAQVAGSLAVGYLGRFDPKKNLEKLIHAVAACPPGVRLEIAGAGDASTHDALQKLTAELDLQGRITWHGFLEGADKDTFLERIDVLAMPSAYECFGMAAGEALAAGTPVVVGRRTGIAAIVERHGCGLVVDPSEDAIAAALARLGSEPGLLGGLAQRTRTAEAQDLSPAIHAARLGEVVASCIGRSAAAARTHGQMERTA